MAHPELYPGVARAGFRRRRATVSSVGRWRGSETVLGAEIFGLLASQIIPLRLSVVGCGAISKCLALETAMG